MACALVGKAPATTLKWFAVTAVLDFGAVVDLVVVGVVLVVVGVEAFTVVVVEAFTVVVVGATVAVEACPEPVDGLASVPAAGMTRPSAIAAPVKSLVRRCRRIAHSSVGHEPRRRGLVTTLRQPG